MEPQSTESTRAAFKAFFLALSVEAQEAFAQSANTTVPYIRTHLVYGNRVPRPGLMDSLTKACAEHGLPITREALILSFYQREPEEQRAAAA